MLIQRAGASIPNVCPMPCSRIGRAYLSSWMPALSVLEGSGRCCIAGQFEHGGETGKERAKGELRGCGPTIEDEEEIPR